MKKAHSLAERTETQAEILRQRLCKQGTLDDALNLSIILPLKRAALNASEAE